jgi:hypothetical protein
MLVSFCPVAYVMCQAHSQASSHAAYHRHFQISVSHLQSLCELHCSNARVCMIHELNTGSVVIDIDRHFLIHLFQTEQQYVNS